MRAFAALASADVGKLKPFINGDVDIDEVPPLERYAIESFSVSNRGGNRAVKVRMASKQRALDSLARINNLFVPDIQTLPEDQGQRFVVLAPPTINDVELWGATAQAEIARLAKGRD